ncbi:MAG: M48 family metallopeptidase [Bacteroidales bacterium]|nr:M48 family metallopeptidase [Bacteroidales bacterium]MBR6774749.1 M48 family metallopeptidase [Bacteroidales bacterium]
MKTFIIKGRLINCEIKRSRRRTVALYVHPDKSVEIRMPLLFSVDEIEPFLIKHSRWLFNRLDLPEKKPVEPKKFVSGELHYFLGKQYPIEIVASDKNSVVFDNEKIVIRQRVDKSTSQQVNLSKSVSVSDLLDRWYLEQAKRVFREISIPLVESMKKYNVAPKSFAIKKMKTRWGSCSSKGNINLNLHLIKLPEQCIKEVILHELCHLVHFNHSKDFYALMTAEMPDWKVWKKEIKFL